MTTEQESVLAQLISDLSTDEHDTIPDDPLNRRDQNEHAVNTVSKLSDAAYAEQVTTFLNPPHHPQY